MALAPTASFVTRPSGDKVFKGQNCYECHQGIWKSVGKIVIHEGQQKFCFGFAHLACFLERCNLPENRSCKLCATRVTILDQVPIDDPEFYTKMGVVKLYEAIQQASSLGNERALATLKQKRPVLSQYERSVAVASAAEQNLTDVVEELMEKGNYDIDEHHRNQALSSAEYHNNGEMLSYLTIRSVGLSDCIIL